MKDSWFCRGCTLFILVVWMALCILVVCCAEGNESFFKVEDGVITGYSGSEANLIIPSEINGMQITAIAKNAFRNKEFLTSVTIPEGVVSIEDDAFIACWDLEHVSLPESLEKIGEYAFSRCAIEAIEIPKNVTSISPAAFASCENLKTIVLKNNEHFTLVDGVLFDGTKLLVYPAGREASSYAAPQGTTSIEPGAFAGSYHLQEVSIPEGVTEIGKHAFYSCGLREARIPEGITTLAYSAFSSCNEMHSIVLPKSLESIEAYAIAATNLRDVFYAGTEEDWKQIGADNSWKNLVMHYECIPDGPLDYSLDKDGNIVDYRGKAEDLVIPQEYYGVKIVGLLNDEEGSAFANNQTIVSLTIPEGIERIPEYTFQNCTNLTRVKIGNSTAVIGGRAFYNCKKLTIIEIGNGLTEIAPYAFNGCNWLKYVNYSGTTEEWNAITIGSNNDPLLNAKIHAFDTVEELDKPVINIDSEYDYGQTVRVDFALNPNVKYYEVSDSAYVDYDEKALRATLVFQTYGWGMKAGENTITVKAIAPEGKGYLDSEETVLTFNVNPMKISVLERYDWTYYRSGERVGIAFYSMIDDYYSDRALYTVTVTDSNGDPVLVWDEEARPSFFDRKSVGGQIYWMALFDQYDWFENGYGPGTYTITVTAYDEGWDETCTESRDFALINDTWGGFEYNRNEDGSVTITDAVADENHIIRIPEEINGMKVSTISKTAFANVDPTDVSIEIPKTVRKVEENAIPSGTAVTTPKNSPSWFYGMAYDWKMTDNKEESVTTLELPAELSSLSANAFESIDAECIILPEGCSVDSGALADCPNLTTVVFHGEAGTLTDIFGEDEDGSGILMVNAEFGEAEKLMDVDF